MTEIDLVMLGAIGLVAESAYRLGNLFNWDSFFSAYWQYAPNAYRAWEQFSLWLYATFSISVSSFTALSFLVFGIAAYFMSRPIRRPELFLLWLMVMAFFGYVMNAPMFLLLCLIVKYRGSKYISVLLLPLIFIKEIAAFIGFSYLFVYQKRKSSIPAFLVAACSYGAFVVLQPVPYGPAAASPFFTPIWIATDYLPKLSPLSFLLLVAVLALVILTAKWSSEELEPPGMNRARVRIWFLLAIPNVLFACPGNLNYGFPLSGCSSRIRARVTLLAVLFLLASRRPFPGNGQSHSRLSQRRDRQSHLQRECQSW